MRTTLPHLSSVAVLLAISALGFSNYQTPAPPGQQSPAPKRELSRLESMIISRETSGSLFENVAAVLSKKYFDERFRREDLPKLISQYRERSRAAIDLRQQRDLVEDFLSHIPASHLGLLSRQTHRYLSHDLEGLPYPTFGFQLMEMQGNFYAAFILEGGPGQRAGLLTWDRVISIDDQPVNTSPRLDWRSDDAYIQDDRDPPVHYVTASKGETIQLKVERSAKRFVTVSITADDYSALAAAKSSAHVYRRDGHNIAYIHLWYIHLSGVPELLKNDIETAFRDCEAFVLDLRGRGGNGAAISKIVELLRQSADTKHWQIIALLDRQSRSAKDVLAYEFKRTGIARLVGEPTAGAVIPASFADVGHDTILMFPSFKLPRYTDLLEFNPVKPDVFVERAGPLSAGSDPILEAGLTEALKRLKARSN